MLIQKGSNIVFSDGYCFAVDDEYGKKGPVIMRRWSSADGINWRDERQAMTSTQHWVNNGMRNMAVVVEVNGRLFLVYDGAQTSIHPEHIGFSIHDTWASIDNVVVRTGSHNELNKYN